MVELYSVLRFDEVPRYFGLRKQRGLKNVNILYLFNFSSRLYFCCVSAHLEVMLACAYLFALGKGSLHYIQLNNTWHKLKETLSNLKDFEWYKRKGSKAEDEVDWFTRVLVQPLNSSKKTRPRSLSNLFHLLLYRRHCNTT